MRFTNRSEGLLTGAVIVSGLMLTLAPAAARADFTALTNPSQVVLGTLIDFENVGFGEITNPNVLAAQGIILPDAPDGDFVVFLSDNRLIDVKAAPAGNSEIRIEFVNPVEAAGIDYITATPLTFVAYANSDFTSEIASTGSVGMAGFFGIGSSDTLIGSIMIHDSLGSFNLDNLVFGTLSSAVTHVPAPAAALLGVMGLGLVAWGRHRRSRPEHRANAARRSTGNSEERHEIQ